MSSLTSLRALLESSPIVLGVDAPSPDCNAVLEASRALSAATALGSASFPERVETAARGDEADVDVDAHMDITFTTDVGVGATFDGARGDYDDSYGESVESVGENTPSVPRSSSAPPLPAWITDPRWARPSDAAQVAQWGTHLRAYSASEAPARDTKRFIDPIAGTRFERMASAHRPAGGSPTSSNLPLPPSSSLPLLDNENGGDVRRTSSPTRGRILARASDADGLRAALRILQARMAPRGRALSARPSVAALALTVRASSADASGRGRQRQREGLNAPLLPGSAAVLDAPGGAAAINVGGGDGVVASAHGGGGAHADDKNGGLNKGAHADDKNVGLNKVADALRLLVESASERRRARLAVERFDDDGNGNMSCNIAAVHADENKAAALLNFAGSRLFDEFNHHAAEAHAAAQRADNGEGGGGAAHRVQTLAAVRTLAGGAREAALGRLRSLRARRAAAADELDALRAASVEGKDAYTKGLLEDVVALCDRRMPLCVCTTRVFLTRSIKVDPPPLFHSPPFFSQLHFGGRCTACWCRSLSPHPS